MNSVNNARPETNTPISDQSHLCEFCNGTVDKTHVDEEIFNHFTGTVILRDVPVGVCSKCGQRYYHASLLRQVETTVQLRDMCRKIDYDQATDTLTIIFAASDVFESHEERVGFIFDYDQNGNVIAVEILDFTQRVNQTGTALESMSQEEIRSIGLAALAKDLGPVGLVRFLQQFSVSRSDYTTNRQAIIAGMDVDTILAEIEANRKSE